MLKSTLLSLFLAAAVSQAAVKELLPNLSSTELEVQTQARLDLLAVCSDAGKPGNEAERKAVCLEICDILKRKQPTVTVVQPLVNNLERIGGEESVPTLAKLLDHKDEHIRDDARRALAVNPSNAAAQALGARLKMRKIRSPKETAGLIYALGERKQSGASKLFVGALASRDEEIFMAAVKTLGVLNEDAGVKALFERRPREKGFRKTQIEAALLETGRKAVYEKLYADSESLHVRSAALLGLILQGDTGKADQAMASGDVALQLAVIEAALQGKNERVYDAVAQHIDSLPPHVQLQALGALEFSGNREYAKVVEPLLKSPDIFIQDNASRALGRIGTSDSVALLMANGRGDALRALGQLSVDGVDEELEKIAGSSSDMKSRVAAIDALAIRGRRDLVPTFVSYVEDDDRTVASSAAKAVGTLGDLSNLDQLTQLMIAKEKDPVSREVLKTIVGIMRKASDSAKAVEILAGHIDGASPRSQANILQALAQTESAEALKPLADACRSNDEQLQKSAVKMLSGWKEDNGLSTMIELASDESMTVANHVTMMRGISRQLASQRRLNTTLANQALEACRRAEERQMIQDVIDNKK